MAPVKHQGLAANDGLQCADRGRRPGGADAGDRSRLARHRRHRGGDAQGRAAAGAEMQSRRRAHHGDFPPARPCRKGAQCRAAGRLSARHQLSHDLYRRGADADQDSLPPRPLHDEGRAGLQLADAGTAASHQPDFPRADPVCARRRATAHPHPQPHRGRGCCGGGNRAAVTLRDLDTGTRGACDAAT